MNVTTAHSDWIQRWALYSPSRVALKDADSGEELTYAAFNKHINRLANWLQQQYELETGDRIAVLAQNNIDYVSLFFAVRSLRCILVPINFRLTAREIQVVLDDSEPKLMVAEKAFNTVISDLNREALSVLSFEGSQGVHDICRNTKLPVENVGRDPEFDDPCMILYTSGTTGKPKGAIITNKMLFWNSINTGLRLNLTQHDVVSTFAPFFHTGGWNVLTTPVLHRGGTVILFRKFDADRVLQLTESEQCSILFGVPTMMDMMHRSELFGSTDLSSVRYAIVGGEPMPLPLIKVWHEKGVPIRQGYGLTEFGPNVFSLNEEDAIRKIGSIGFPNFYINVQVQDDEGKTLGPGEIGELCLKGTACTPGYWRNPEATKQTIVNGWLKTGDLVRYDEEGYFYVVDRKKDMFISGAENVYPAEIEHYLRSLNGVREAAVIGVADEKWGEVGHAFIVLENESGVSETSLTAYCREGLAKYKVPKYFTLVDELPKSDSGKILKKNLKDYLLTT